MYFVVLGVLLLLMKVLSFEPVAEWGWIAVLWPFGAAVLWWAYADKTGLTRRREMNKMEERKVGRRRKHLLALGIDPRTARSSDRVKNQRQANAAKVEADRQQARQHNEAVVARSSRLGPLDEPRS